MNIKTDVQSFTVKDVNGNIIKETIIDKARNFEIISFIYEYDNNGRLVKEIADDGFGNSVEVSYEYDFMGRHVQICETEIDRNQHRYPHTAKYYYGSNGKITRQICIYSTVYYITDYFYDNCGNMIKSIETDEFGEKVVTEYEYDSEGNKTNKTEYTPDGKAHCITTYAYDEEGHLLYKETYTVAGIGAGFHKINEYYYDEQGRKSRKIIKYLNRNSEIESVAEIRYIADSNGKVIMSKNLNCAYNEIEYYYNTQGRLIITDSFNYNNDMNYLMRNIYWGHFGTINSFFNYEYGSGGNCVSISSQKIDGT